MGVRIFGRVLSAPFASSGRSRPGGADEALSALCSANRSKPSWAPHAAEAAEQLAALKDGRDIELCQPAVR